MKPFVKVLLFSLVSLTIGINVQAAEKHTSTDVMDFFDQEPVPFSQQANTIIAWHNAYKNLPQNQWDSSPTYQYTRAFCLKNPMLQWLESPKSTSGDKEQFLNAIRSGIWQNQLHRINSFIELIIFLYDRVNAYKRLLILQQAAHETSFHSPKLKAAKHEEFKDLDVKELINEVYDTFEQKQTSAFAFALDQEWSFLHSEYSSNDWLAFVKNAFMSPLSQIQISKIEVFSQQAEKFLSRIFKNDPTFNQ